MSFPPIKAPENESRKVAFVKTDQDDVPVLPKKAKTVSYTSLFKYADTELKLL